MFTCNCDRCQGRGPKDAPEITEDNWATACEEADFAFDYPCEGDCELTVAPCDELDWDEENDLCNNCGHRKECHKGEY